MIFNFTQPQIREHGVETLTVLLSLICCFMLVRPHIFLLLALRLLLWPFLLLVAVLGACRRLLTVLLFSMFVSCGASRRFRSPATIHFRRCLVSVDKNRGGFAPLALQFTDLLRRSGRFEHVQSAHEALHLRVYVFLRLRYPKLHAVAVGAQAHLGNLQLCTQRA